MPAGFFTASESLPLLKHYSVKLNSDRHEKLPLNAVAHPRVTSIEVFIIWLRMPILLQEAVSRKMVLQSYSSVERTISRNGLLSFLSLGWIDFKNI